MYQKQHKKQPSQLILDAQKLLEKQGCRLILVITLLCYNEMQKEINLQIIPKLILKTGPQLVEEHGVNNLNQIPTSRFDMKSQSEPVMTDIDRDLEQPKVKG